MPAVVFDLGNVMIPWHPQPLLSAEFVAETDFFGWNTQLDGGAPFEPTIAALKQRFPRFAAEFDAFRDRWGELLGPPIDGSVQLVDDLKANGVGVYVLSNASVEAPRRSAALAALLTHFDGVVLSGAEQLLKPDPAIYALTAERFGLTPSTTWFIDDSQANVDAAAALGWHAIHFTDPATTRAELAAAGLL